MKHKEISAAMGAALCLSMATTLSILIREGRWPEAIPLHLCSVSAIAAATLAFGAGQGALDFLWYLGMPGAVLALLFPAPAAAERQAAMTLSYYATHALILAIPAWMMRAGARPRAGRGAAMFLRLQGIAAAAHAVNAALDTNFLFLAAPPVGTPLEAVFHLGRPAYLLALEGCMGLSLLGMRALLGRWLTAGRESGQKAKIACGTFAKEV